MEFLTNHKMQHKTELNHLLCFIVVIKVANSQEKAALYMFGDEGTVEVPGLSDA